MKKAILAIALLVSVLAYSQETASDFKDRLRETNYKQVVPKWFYNRADYMIDWGYTNMLYQAGLKINVSDTVTRAKVITRKSADSLYLKVSSFDSLLLAGVATSLADDDSINLPNAICGLVWITADTAGVIDEYMCVAISSNGSVILTPNVSTNVDDANTDAKLCVYDIGTRVTVKNRLGYRRTIKIKYMY